MATSTRTQAATESPDDVDFDAGPSVYKLFHFMWYIYIDGWVESLISHNIEANGFGKLSGLASADRWALWLTTHRGRPLACIWRPSFHFTLSIVGS